MSIFSKLASLVTDAFPPAKLAKGVIELVKGKTGTDLSELEPEIQQLMIERDTARDKYAAELRQAELNAQRDVLVAEAKGESWLQRNWRPLTMLVFVFIIANNFILVPYVSAFGGNVPALDIPNGMWALLNVGIGGYIGSRGVEKWQRIKNEGIKDKITE